jgi:hypothetical protein
MNKFGFKDVTVGNWLKADSHLCAMVRFSHLPNDFDPNEANEWVKEILSINMDERVPEDIRKMFVVARATVVYGTLFYPLFALANEQLYRIADAAVVHRCRQLKAPESLRGMEGRLDWLLAQNSISPLGRSIWDAIRKLGNFASHSDRQSLVWAATPVGHLSQIAIDIEALFGLRPPRWADNEKTVNLDDSSSDANLVGKGSSLFKA